MNNSELVFGAMKFKIYHTPGHAPGHVVFFNQENKFVINSYFTITLRYEINTEHPHSICFIWKNTWHSLIVFEFLFKNKLFVFLFFVVVAAF